MNWFRHLTESEIALHAGRDLAPVPRMRAQLHLLGCPRCQARLAAYAEARRLMKESCEDLPAGLDWDALSAEMTANIHLGLTAGAIVSRERTPAREPHSVAFTPVRLQAAAVFASLAVVLASAWLLQRTGPALPPAPVRAVLELPSGVELRTVDFDGAERARQLDGETGQVTITQVYAD